MLILGLLGMYFDAAVVFVTSQTLLLKLTVAILCKYDVHIATNMNCSVQDLYLITLAAVSSFTKKAGKKYLSLVR